MPTPDLPTKAKQLLARRTVPHNVWYYATRNATRQLLCIVGYVSRIAGLGKDRGTRTGRFRLNMKYSPRHETRNRQRQC